MFLTIKTWFPPIYTASALLLHDLFCSVKMSAGQVQYEGVLHPRWLHLGGSEPLPAHPGPLLSGCDEGVSLRSSASGIYCSLANRTEVLQCIFLYLKVRISQSNKPRVTTCLIIQDSLVHRSLNHIYLLWQKKLTGMFRVSWSQ